MGATPARLCSPVGRNRPFAGSGRSAASASSRSCFAPPGRRGRSRARPARSWPSVWPPAGRVRPPFRCRCGRRGAGRRGTAARPPGGKGPRSHGIRAGSRRSASRPGIRPPPAGRRFGGARECAPGILPGSRRIPLAGAAGTSESVPESRVLRTPAVSGPARHGRGAGGGPAATGLRPRAAPPPAAPGVRCRTRILPGGREEGRGESSLCRRISRPALAWKTRIRILTGIESAVKSAGAASYRHRLPKKKRAPIRRLSQS